MKALMVIDGKTISPFDIKSIEGTHGRRCCWDSWNRKKLWHPLMDTYIDLLPWWKRGMARRKFQCAWYYHKPFVQVRLNDSWNNIRFECKNNRECDEMLTQLRNEWDQALAKFHGTGCNFGLKDK
jgi:hypothetical protein